MSSPSTEGASGREALSSPVTTISNSTSSPTLTFLDDKVPRTFDSANTAHSGSSSASSVATRIRRRKKNRRDIVRLPVLERPGRILHRFVLGIYQPHAPIHALQRLQNLRRVLLGHAAFL